MAPGYKMTVEHLIEMMLSGVGIRGANDTKVHIFETVYGFIRSQPWSWNFVESNDITYAPIISTENYVWTAGDNFVDSTSTLSLSEKNTGRFFELDGIRYRVVNIDTSLNRLYLDKKLASTQLSPGVTLTFYRGDFVVRTSSIHSVYVDGVRVFSTTPDYWRKISSNTYKTVQALGGARPTNYIVRENWKLDPPTFAPTPNGAPSSGNIEAGTYKYFYTRVDTETGLESPPSPEIEVTYSSTSQQQFAYPNGNIVEGPSYNIRLYRSKVGASGTRYPAWLVGERTAKNSSGYITDNYSDSQLILGTRYYDGPQTVIEWSLWPDNVYDVQTMHVNDYGGRPDMGDYVYTGTSNVVPELLKLGASAYVMLSGRSTSEYRSAIVNFRSQMSYLLKHSESANADDPGLEETAFNDGIPGRRETDPIGTFRWKS